MNYTLYPASVIQTPSAWVALARTDTGARLLAVRGDTQGIETRWRDGETWLCLRSPANAAALRARIPWLNPVPARLHPSAGLGDRLGLATPGHARAAAETSMQPLFAQQSVRENARTGRTPLSVLDDAMWGVFQAGWRRPWGADADHLKTTQDALPFIQAGYSFYTVDPGEHVGAVSPGESLEQLRALFAQLDWPGLGCSPQELYNIYLGREIGLEGFAVHFDEDSLLRAALKYANAMAHTARMFNFLLQQMPGRSFDFEVSVDETDQPTSPTEHAFIASELVRMGVCWTSLAPRFVGAFEKGVDYIGDLKVLDSAIAQHAAVARSFGGYKLSLHSGSDKFSVYPLAARHCQGRVHLKTAGTSYLEALRCAAGHAPDLFRRIYASSRERYPIDRASYHVSAELARAPQLDSLTDASLPTLLEDFDARQILHVAFGSSLAEFGGELKAFLEANEEIYASTLAVHFRKHLEPLQIF